MADEHQQTSTADRLSFTIFLAIALHAILILGISFSVESGNQVAPTLEITLASYKSHKAPEQADYLAQFNQEASGTAEKAQELTTEEIAKIADTQVNRIQPQPQSRASALAVTQTQVVSTQGQSQQKSLKLKEVDKQKALEKQSGEKSDLPILSAEIASLKAKLDQQRQEYAKKPRIRRLTSIAAKASYDAEYLHKWSSKVEYVGNNNYPEEALRDKVFGDLRLAAVILPNGTIHNIEILQSSGHKILDDAAKQIVHLASPFPPFPPEIRKQADQLEIIRTWHFEITGLSTTN